MYSRVQEKACNHRGILHRFLASKAAILVVCLLTLSSIFAFSSTIFSVDLAKSPEQTASTYTINATDVTFSASPTSAFVGDEITFFANATSSDQSATLTFTIFYDYYTKPGLTINTKSARTVNTTSVPGQVITKYAYDHPGNFTLSGRPFFWVYLFVADGSGSNVSKYVQVFVNYNQPPVLKTALPDPLQTNAGVPTDITALIADADSDTVTVNWDFGDGTTVTDVIVASPTGVYANQTHTWDPRIPGNGSYTAAYKLNVTLSDGVNPQVNYSTDVSVLVGYNFAPDLQVFASERLVNPLDVINFTANASDAEGDPLTWTFNYSDGTIEVFHTDWTSPGLLVWQNSTHSFNAVGNYTVNISVSDALIPYQVGEHNVTLTLPIRVVENVPPWVASSIIADPGSPLINATIGYVNVSLRIDAQDADGDVLTVTWNMGNGDIRTVTSQGGTGIYSSFQVIVFNDTGTYNITVTVTDGRAGHATERNLTLNVTSNNLPPSVLRFDHLPYASGKTGFAAPNESVTFEIILSDPEQDKLSLIIDFGDGSPRMYMNLTNYSNGNITVTVAHEFTSFGNYTARIFVTDNKMGLLNHTITFQVPVRVFIPPVIPVAAWDWWDFTSLGLLASVPILMVIWFLRLRQQRQQIERQGMTYDEWKLRKEIDLEELNK